MKMIVSIVNAILFFVLFSVSVTTHASEISVVLDGDQAISIQIKKENVGAVHLLLKNIDGVVYHQESALKASIKNRSIDLQFIPEGLYNLMVEYNNVIKIQPIRKHGNKLEVNASELKTTFVPSVRQFDQRLDLDMLFLGAFEVELSLISSDGEIVYNTSKQHSGTYHRRLGLKGLEEDNYTFLIKIESQNMTKLFSHEISYFDMVVKN